MAGATEQCLGELVVDEWVVVDNHQAEACPLLHILLLLLPRSQSTLVVVYDFHIVRLLAPKTSQGVTDGGHKLHPDTVEGAVVLVLKVLEVLLTGGQHCTHVVVEGMAKV